MTKLKEYLKSDFFRNDLDKLTSFSNLITIVVIISGVSIFSGEFWINLLNFFLATLCVFVIFFIIRFFFVYPKIKQSSYTKVKDMKCFAPILKLILANSPNATTGVDIKKELKVPYQKFNKVIHYLVEKEAIRLTYPKGMLHQYYFIWVTDTDKIEKSLEESSK